MPGRTIAIGDIHGCSAALDALPTLREERPGLVDHHNESVELTLALAGLPSDFDLRQEVVDEGLDHGVALIW